MNVRNAGLVVNRWLERLMFVWLLSSMGIGYLFHTMMARWDGAVILLFACMTFVTALGTRFKEFGYVATRPIVLTTMFVLLHAVMPITAYWVGKMTMLPPNYVVGVVLASAIPVGVTSVMWTGMAKGDLPLGLSIVSLDTLLSPLVIPLTIRTIVGKSVGLPFWTLFWGLVWMVVLPTALGILVNELSRGRAKPVLQPFAGPLSKLSMLAVVAINVAVVTPSFSHHSGIGPVLSVLVCMAGFGYLLGFLAAKTGRVNQSTQITMTYNVGMRNISAGIAIASRYFGHTVSIPVVLAMLFQQPFATLVFWLINRKRRTLVPHHSHGPTGHPNS